MSLLRAIRRLIAAILSPLPLGCALLVLACVDCLFKLFGRRVAAVNTPASRDAVSVVIPTWNGLDLLKKYLPSVLRALEGNAAHEVIVVDNASGDGTAEYLREHFPTVRVLAQTVNLGFGGGSNAGFNAAKNDIVVLLNNDMRVEPDFLAPLLEPFVDPSVFAVACQIFFSDPAKRREETGLTETWWQGGRLVASHHAEPEINRPFPCAYPGGGSSAFDRRKFLEIGGFDELYRPFYCEDTDVGIVAWKRGWKVLYQPRSVVWHEHRGTIGKNFGRDYIDGVVQRNMLLFTWKNIHDWSMLGPGFVNALTTALLGTLLWRKKGQHRVSAIWGGFARLHEVVKTRWNAHVLASINDQEAFRRQKGGYFRDRFETDGSAPTRLQVLFISPYHIEPPTHGGALSMRETIRALSRDADVHLLCFVDDDAQIPPHEALKPYCASTTFLVRKHHSFRMPLGLKSRAEVEFRDRDFEWAMHRIMLLHNIDVVQIEYAMMSQYVCDYRRIPSFLFEHDIAFQSMASGFATKPRAGYAFAYMQLLYMELRNAPRFARVQVCTEENKQYLLSFAPHLKGRVDGDLRAVIDTSAYQFSTSDREPDSILFIGSFNHLPNLEAVDWVLTHVWPNVRNARPNAKFYIVGSGSAHALGSKLEQPGVQLLGFVDDIKTLLASKAVLISPILSGSGVRMKLMEAFAAGIPVVSTYLGAEGLARVPSEYCELADTPGEFAAAISRLLSDPAYASEMAVRARGMVERERDSVAVTRRLAESYTKEVAKRRPRPLPIEAVDHTELARVKTV